MNEAIAAKNKALVSLNNTKKAAITNKLTDVFSMVTNIYTINIKTTVTWHHDYYGCQGYKKGNN